MNIDTNNLISALKNVFDSGSEHAETKADVRNLAANFQSHKHDIKLALEKVEKKLDTMPTLDNFKVLMTEDREKTTTGIYKRLDAVEDNQKMKTAFVAGITFMGSCVTGLAMWIINTVFK